jgi:3-oxoacyl-[acyl-carrier-protein] synthase-3
MTLRRPFARLTGLGTAVPEKVVTNAWFEERLDTSDAWIVERTGIRERRHAGPDESVTELARLASVAALAQAGRSPMDLDSIVLGTATPDRLLPSTACDLQAVLGANRAAAFDVSAACPGFLYAMTVAEGLIASGQSERSLILGAEKLTCITDFEDRSTAILFGDGAGAAVLERTEPTGARSRGILSTFIGSDGRLGDLLYRPGGGAAHPISHDVVDDRSHFLKMQGREVFKAAVRAMADACDEAIQRAGITADQIDLLVPHQANIRIIEATAKHAGMPMDRVMVNVDRYGNTSSASIPIALDEAVQQGRIGPDSLVLLVAFGAGFTWASAVIRWG